MTDIPKKDYSPPAVWRVSRSGSPQRLGCPKVIDEVDGVPVSDLVEKYGSPLFVFSEARLRSAVRDLKSAFRKVYPKVTLAWSYKTNYLNAICGVFHQEGSWAEVVSGFEYEKALHNGIPGSRIVFNGPYKTEAELRRAVDEYSMIQVDNSDELLALAKIASEKNKDIRIGIRVNMDTGTHAVWSKFGFSADTGEALRAIRWASGNTRLKVVGIHSHIGTFMLESSAYETSVKKMVELSSAMEKYTGSPAEYLNIGGGFASHARLHGQYLPPEQATPPFDEYAKIICGAIRASWPSDRDLPLLVLETGRALVDDAGYLITSVVAVKKRESCPSQASVMDSYGKSTASMAMAAYGKGVPSQIAEPRRNALVLDSGINVLYTAAWYNPSIHPSREIPSPPRPTTAFGCLCMNIDVIREEVWLPEMSKGDVLVIHPVGAYNITQSMQFIAYRPAVVMVEANGETHLIRRRENLQDVQGPELVPAHLSPPYDLEKVK